MGLVARLERFTVKLSRTSLGLAIRTARKAAGLTADELATRAGIDRSALSRTENGKRALEFDEALAIASVVGVDITAIRTLAETFEREGVAAKRDAQRTIENDLNQLQRAAIEAAIEFSQP